MTAPLNKMRDDKFHLEKWLFLNSWLKGLFNCPKTLHLVRKLFKDSATVPYTTPRFSAKSDGKHVPESSLFIYSIFHAMVTQRRKARALDLVGVFAWSSLAGVKGGGGHEYNCDGSLEGPYTADALAGAAQLRAAVKCQLQLLYCIYV